jgi:2-polyprenyl-6-methoxyphenol hydroxylase-like FAD-dependent oxidoreductase
MRKNEYTKNYDITIVGGGLAGKLMLSLLINCGAFDENKLCWINKDNENFKDVRVSFINYKNFLKLKKSIRFDISSRDYSIIDKIELHNTNEKYPLKLKDLNNHGIIIRNDVLKKNIKFSEKKVDIYKSKVISTKFDKFNRYLFLKDGTKIKSALVISADGSLSPLRELCKIKYLNNNLNHTIITGYLECKNFNYSTAKQIFLKDNFIGLLPVNDEKNLINFVWSIDNKILKSNKINFHEKIIQMLNKFFLRNNLTFNSPKSKEDKFKRVQTYPINVKFVNNPFKERIILIGDAAHTIHPLAGQGFNLSIEDCFDMAKCLKNAKFVGRDFGTLSLLKAYNSIRKTRKNFITLATTLIFYVFSKKHNQLNSIINYGIEKIEKTSLKEIFKFLAKGY